MRKVKACTLPVLALVLAVCCAVQLSPQSPESRPSAHAHEVVLTVTVRDKHGALVASLQKGDLALAEDGRAQTIQTLTHDNNLPFRVGLLVDTSQAMNGALKAEREAAGGFVDAVLPANGETKDQAFLIHFDREVELLEDLTNSREAIHREIDDLGPTRQERYDSQGPETAGDDRGSARHGHNGTQLYDAIYLASDEVMKSQVGRKALVVFSDGADRGSKDTLNDAIDAADRANVEIFTIFLKGEQEHNEIGFPSGGRHGGVGGGWPGSGGGGRRGGGEPTSAAGVDGKKIMQQIATRTGGHAYEAKKSGDLGPIYKLIEEELRGQYLLTYTPDKADPEGGFHKIVLTANDKDLTVSTREGYYPPDSRD